MLWVRSIALFAITLCAIGATACDYGSSQQASSSTVAAPSEGRPAPGDQTVNLEFGGKTRSYVVHAPPGFNGNTALPLVVSLHHRPGDAARSATLTGWNAKADKENFLVVYPEGYNSAYNALICCGGEDDVGFIKTIVASMISKWKVDPRHVYAAGISNGGDMSFKLAVELPGTFAAIAPVSGGFIGQTAEQPTYTPKTPVSVITFLGGKDSHFARIDAGINQWQARLACAPVGEPAGLDKGITLATAKCADGSDVQTYRLPEMGHAWPGASRGDLTAPDAGLNATDLVWDFFKAHIHGA
ncbi:alpha/beta hydrolase family esterase [Nocardia sp. NPDC052566]|uniref:extracellular catalytic domain type 1 short-chain-length polyhydroxyalkanoate depolymerase n=1 Tax=Nocardia sp. NPDC052566 TaxID=3364330 RepID=UPI0037C616EC